MIKLASGRLGEDARVVWESTSSLQRLKLEKDHPAVCAEVYDKTCRAVIEDLFGVRLSDGHKRESFPGEQKGIFGHVRAVHGVTEAQQRGSLHLHLLLWCLYGPQFSVEGIVTIFSATACAFRGSVKCQVYQGFKVQRRSLVGVGACAPTAF